MQFAKFFLEKRFRFFFSALVDVIILNMILLIISFLVVIFFFFLSLHLRKVYIRWQHPRFLLFLFLRFFIIWMLLNHSDAAALRTKFYRNEKQPFFFLYLVYA